MTSPLLQQYIQGQGTVSADNLNTFEQTCDNVIQLRAFTGTVGIQVFLRGFVTPGDGGQGPFYWNALSTTPDDNGITTIVPLGTSPGAWSRITILAKTTTIGTGTLLTSGSSAAVSSQSLFFEVNKTVGSPTTVNLPLTPSQWERHYIKDGKGDAGTNNITVAGGPFLIDGFATFVMNSNYQAIGVYFNGTAWRVF